ncbi:MAG: hypothetical protein HFJ94_02085 [Muribaculaceae bacterium]|nr:hypothetical protein [Muribaculaceae bacterium]
MKIKQFCSLLLTALVPLTLSAEKVLALMPGIIYFKDGSVEELVDSSRIAIPQKQKDLLILDHAYTHRQNIGRRISPEDVDSVVIWSVTSPERRHTLCYFKESGWCWLLDKANGLMVCAFSPKGYHISGNGGMWCRGKCDGIVYKEGTPHRFSKLTKQSNESFRRKVAALVADDPELARQIMSGRMRRDKTLRMLAGYNPGK